MGDKLKRSNIAKLIYFSRSTDIFTNLALEDWLYTNRNFTNQPMLMLWRNKPCVVIGRHQNPWLESNFAMLPQMGAELARRNSGGGTVYHDMGNLNLTFFTSRDSYSRRRNLELLSRALSTHFNLAPEITKREDLCINGLKISGTASKLGRTNAYHHCTLLVNANTAHISLALKNLLGPHVKTNASVSVRSPIMNLNEERPGITVEEVMSAVISEWSSEVAVVDSIDDDHFPGVSQTRQKFLSEEWRFGRTPKFTLYRSVFQQLNIRAFLAVEKGKVANVGMEGDSVQFSVEKNNLEGLEGLMEVFIGKPFSKELLDEFEMVVAGLKNSSQCLTMITNT
ncbi:lipoyltransferase 1, mitochondrial isoform X1 [Dendroctonus ponderosae]|uniref:lipoyltransferase 1, mitochondrial isoform X1 n=1 Tax=Dendroctonus ponderosae TaxID=77166 RepID=UPI0020362F05|nr:lipoyltransferase 1, mitochondrial isoform X1 [Dendroctonus ponderosae]XP_048520094.1 lipoyltransferase 1, mitochondrial isoform X1 [Dendroctonus ponderosae]KAH1026135.1 hypothetical protein HUJ05_010703 [Dendroctonus ponderosae]